MIDIVGDYKWWGSRVASSEKVNKSRRTRVVHSPRTVQSIFAMSRIVVFTVKEADSTRDALSMSLECQHDVLLDCLDILAAHRWHLPVELRKGSFLRVVCRHIGRIHQL